MEEKELFEHYEHKSWEWSPRLYKLFGAATLINLLGLFAIGQFNILSTRGCDTPIVGIVCQAVDSAYVASTFLGKDNEWESRPYTQTEIGEEQEVTFIDVSNQLKYPEGYFAQTAEPTEVLPGSDEISTNFGSNNSLTPTPSQSNEKDLGVQVLPTPNTDVGKQETVDEPFNFGGGDKPKYKTPPTVKRTPKPTKTKLPDESPKTLPGDDVVAKATPKPTPNPTPKPQTDQEAIDGFSQKFNNQPLKDFAEDVIAKIDSKDPKQQVDLKQPFKVVLDGTLTEKGTFDAKKTRFIVNKGEEQTGMILVAKDAIQKLGDTGLLGYLKDLGTDTVNITLVQDDAKIYAIIRSDQPNESRARTISSGFNLLIDGAKGRVKEEEVKMLLNAVKFKPEGKSFVINFEMPKEEAHKLIDQKLQEARQKKLQNNNDDGGKQATAKGL